MDEIRNMWGEPASKDLFFVASMTDYYYLETLSSTAITHVYQDGIKLKVLGRNIRTFKPGVPFSIQVSESCECLFSAALLAIEVVNTGIQLALFCFKQRANFLCNLSYHPIQYIYSTLFTMKW